MKANAIATLFYLLSGSTDTGEVDNLSSVNKTLKALVSLN